MRELSPMRRALRNARRKKGDTGQANVVLRDAMEALSCTGRSVDATRRVQSVLAGLALDREVVSRVQKGRKVMQPVPIRRSRAQSVAIGWLLRGMEKGVMSGKTAAHALAHELLLAYRDRKAMSEDSKPESVAVQERVRAVREAKANQGNVSAVTTRGREEESSRLPIMREPALVVRVSKPLGVQMVSRRKRRERADLRGVVRVANVKGTKG